MAELLSQILLRCDSYTAWSENDPVLGNGELAVVVLTTDDDNLNDTTDTILFKIGNGTKKFSELGWTSSLAADVYEWAKAATRPVYTYGDSDLKGFGTAASHNIEATVTDSNNIPTSAALIKYIANYIAKLDKVEKIEKIDFTDTDTDITSDVKIPIGSVIRSAELQINTPTTKTSQGAADFLKLGSGNLVDFVIIKEEDLDFETITTASLLPETFIFNGINKKTTIENSVMIDSGNFPGISGSVYIKYI